MDIISGFIFVATCWLNSQPLAHASCGPRGVGGIVPGNSIVSLQVRNGYFSSYVQDDDGFLVAHMALAHCARKEGMGLALPEEKAQCIGTAQRQVLSVDTVPSPPPSNFSATPNQVSTIAKIQEACGFDYSQAWSEARRERDSRPFACDDMKGVIEKAAARSREYLREQNDPANIANIDAPKAVIDRYLADVRSSDAALQAIANFFKSPRTNGEFYRLAETLKDQTQTRSYQVAKEATSDINPALQKPFAEVAEILNIDFPNPDAPNRQGPLRVGRVRCGGGPLPTVPEALAGLEWSVRGPGVRTIGGRPEGDQSDNGGAQ